MSTTPILYHGTTAARAQRILNNGFRRAKEPSYTGTSVNLSESISVAYEYGAYENKGCVLEVELAKNIQFSENGLPQGNPDFDSGFRSSGLDALSLYGGNVWLLWSVHKVAQVRLLTHQEALTKLCQEFDDNGPGMGYNGVIDDYAEIWWDNEAGSSHLRRSPDHANRLRRRLHTMVGHYRSHQLATA